MAMIINTVKYEDRVINLSNPNFNDEANVFTAIIGRNGSGKSKLLQKICLMCLYAYAKKHSTDVMRAKDLLDSDEYGIFSRIDETGEIELINMGESTHIIIDYFDTSHWLPIYPTDKRQAADLSLKHSQQKPIKLISNNVEKDQLEIYPRIIAVSSTPFDKYPLLNNYRLPGNLTEECYLYRGAKTKNRVGGRESYIQSKFNQLGKSLLNTLLKPERGIQLQYLLDYLDIKSEYEICFNLSHLADLLFHQPHKTEYFESIIRQQNNNTSLTDKVIESIKNDIQNLRLSNARLEPDALNIRDYSFSIKISDSFQSKEQIDLCNLVLRLSNQDLISVVDITFNRPLNKISLHISNASSGELCTLFNILSIAGSIRDNSIILIDEPELSLHPKWQQDFMPLLTNTFSHLKGCHFIIATHSPHIISGLPDSNSFVVNLEENPAIAFSGEATTLKSSDYQLAETFKSPGFKNEYLISQAIQALTKLGNGSELNSSLTNSIESLLEFLKITTSNDPAKKLLETLKTAFETLKNESN